MISIELLQEMATLCQRNLQLEGQLLELEASASLLAAEVRTCWQTEATLLANESQLEQMVLHFQRLVEQSSVAPPPAQLTSVLDLTHDAILSLDGQQQITRFNPSAEQLFGYLAAEVLGQPLTLLLPSWCAPAPSRDRASARIVGERHTLWGRHKDGRSVPVEAVSTQLEQGNDWRYTVILRDVSDRPRAQHTLQHSEVNLEQTVGQLETALQRLQHTPLQLIQQEKLSSLSQLVAGVVHEINNPIHFIAGNLAHAQGYLEELLAPLRLYQQHPAPSPEIEQQAAAIDLNFLATDLPKLLTSMRLGVDRVQAIVRALRLFSRLDGMAMQLDLQAGLESILLILQHRLKPRPDRAGIQVIKDYAPLPPIRCYAGPLTQVFMTLLSTAIEALEARDHERTLTQMRQSPSQIHIQTARLSPDRVAIRIRDNGIGLAAALQAESLEPLTPASQRTGLALSMSQQIVTEQHGGTLVWHASPAGTEFVIELPIGQPIAVRGLAPA